MTSSLSTVESVLALLNRSVSPGRVVSCSIREAFGAVLADDVHARWDLPQRDVSIMDGYAVRASDFAAAGARLGLALVGESAAGRPSAEPLGPGEAMRISTGAVLPPGSDAVIAQEDCQRDGGRVIVDVDRAGPVRSGKFVRPAGSDQREGQRVLPAGAVLGPGELAFCAAAGHPIVRIYDRPSVGIVSTGDELVALGDEPSPGQIVSTNGLMLAAMVRRAGGIPHDFGDVEDRPEALRECLRGTTHCDVLCTTGGISVGAHDHVHDVLVELGCAFEVHGVAMRPGKPFAFGRWGSTLVFALPGNPASAFVAFELFVRPVLDRLRAAEPPSRVRVVELVNEAAGAGDRVHYVRARLDASGERATVLDDQRSGNLRSLSGADALLMVPAGVDRLAPGSRVDAIHVRDGWIA